MKKTKKVGGLTFLASIPALLILDILIVRNLIPLIIENPPFLLWWILGGSLLGVIFAPLFSEGRPYVFIHEVKHAIVSSLAGNKWKKMTVNADSGSFEYSYYKHTAHLNAFISLAPYWFPIISIPLWLLTLTNKNPEALRLAMGFALGLDLYMGIKDIGPHQTDLSTIRGGVKIAKSYIWLMITLVISLTILGGSLGLAGFKALGIGILRDLVFCARNLGFI